MEADILCNSNQNTAEVAIVISDKIGFDFKPMKRYKEGYYILIKFNSPRRYNNYKHTCTWTK